MQFLIDNMSCGGCVQSVTKAVTALDPAATVQADLTARTVQIETSASPAVVQQALERNGWNAKAA